MSFPENAEEIKPDSDASSEVSEETESGEVGVEEKGAEEKAKIDVAEIPEE